MKKVLFAFILCSIGVISCKKEDTGENQNLDPKDQRKYDLMTNETGSWWMYGGSDSTVTIRKATGRDSVVKGFFFSYYEKYDTTSADRLIYPEFFGKNTNRYITLQDIDGNYTQFVTVIFFKDSVGINETWTNTDNYSYGFLNFDIKVESRITDTGGIMQINNHSFHHVFQVHNDLFGKLSTGGSDYVKAGTLDMWFVQGIGIIKQDINVNVAGGLVKKVYRDSLLDYHLVESQ